jgi:hypothetical protein
VAEVHRLTAISSRPTRDGDTKIHILTTLSARNVPAVKGAEVDRKRRTIEGLFFEVSRTPSCASRSLWGAAPGVGAEVSHLPDESRMGHAPGR